MNLKIQFYRQTMWTYFGCAVLGYLLALLLEKREKITRVYQNIAPYHGPFKSIFRTISTIYKTQATELHNVYVKMLKSVHHVSPDIYEVEYYHRHKKYRMRLSVDRRSLVTPWIEAFDENNVNITDKLRQYLGPNYDFHGRTVTPADLGHTRIRIFDDNLRMKEFKNREPMSMDSFIQIVSNE